MQLLKLNDLIKISELLAENNFNNKNITITIDVKTKELLNKINEDIYYRNDVNENNPPIKEVDEIVLNINGTTFKYFY